MTASSLRTLDRAARRHLIWHAVLRPLATTVLLVGLYYLLPLDRVHVRLAVILVAGILIVLAVSAWQLHAITRSRYPAVRAIDALATTAPLFLLLFAATYYLMARTSPGSFNPDHLTRTDTLYFTVTTFSTVGFGDITAASQAARLVVTVQMLLDLLVLGLGIRAFVTAVRVGRSRPPTDPDAPADPATPQNPDAP